jgi:hypothetical protein
LPSMSMVRSVPPLIRISTFSFISQNLELFRGYLVFIIN